MTDKIIENTADEIPFALGAKKDKKDRRDYRLASIQAPESLPKKFSVEDPFFPNNQFSRGSCTSQAQAHHKERHEKVELAARFVMALVKQYEGNTNYGAYTRNTFKIVKKHGACVQDLYPEPDSKMSWEEYIDVAHIPAKCYKDAEKHKSKSFWRVENDIESIKQAIYKQKSSVVISMPWYREFNHPNPQGYLNAPVHMVGGHAVDVAGWDDNNGEGYLLVKNSWGQSWGLGGFFKFQYKYAKQYIWDAWQSLDIPENVAVDNRYGYGRTWVSFLREKRIAFNPWLRGKIKRLPNNREINALAYGYWGFDSVFKAVHGDIWLHKTKPQAIKDGDIEA